MDTMRTPAPTGALFHKAVPWCANYLSEPWGAGLSSGYYAFKSRRPASYEIRDAELKEKIITIYKENFSYYDVSTRMSETMVARVFKMPKA